MCVHVGAKSRVMLLYAFRFMCGDVFMPRMLFASVVIVL